MNGPLTTQQSGGPTTTWGGEDMTERQVGDSGRLAEAHPGRSTDPTPQSVA